MRLKKADRLRLATLVTIGVCSTVVVMMLALLILVDHFATSYAKQQAYERLQHLSWQMRDSLDRGINRAIAQTRMVADLNTVRDANNSDDIRQVFDNLQDKFSNYAWIGLTDTAGVVFASTNGLLQGVNVSERPWFINGQQQLFTGDYHPALLLEKKLPEIEGNWRFVDVSLPVRRSNGEYRGVMGVHLSWEWARGIANSLLIPADRQYQVEVIVVRDDGMIILGPEHLQETKISTSSLALARSGKAGAIAETWADGRRYLTGYSQTGVNASNSSLKWSILIRQPEEVALATFRDLQQQILMVGGGIGFLLAIVAVGLTRRLAKPLDALSAAIMRQNEDGTIDTIPILDGYHEVHLLSMTLADMVTRERQHVVHLRALNENLEHLVQERTSEIEQKAKALEDSLAQQIIIQQRLKDSEAELRATLQNANDAFIAMDQDGVIVDWNDQAERLLGWTRHEALGQKAMDMMIPSTLLDGFKRGMYQFPDTVESKVINRRMEITAVRRDGVEFPVELALAAVPIQQGYRFIAFLHDITERQMQQASLKAMALKDALTDLSNRRALMQKLPESMARAKRIGKPMAVFFLDIDDFKGVNDGYGHEAGDELLRTLAQRIVGVVRATDTVARLAGDEFVVVLEMLNGNADALDVAEKILQAIQQPFALTAATLTLSGSIGIVMYRPDDVTNPDQLITLADGAMYAAKKMGKNRAVVV